MKSGLDSTGRENWRCNKEIEVENDVGKGARESQKTESTLRAELEVRSSNPRVR